MLKKITNYLLLKNFVGSIASTNIDSKYRVQLYQYSTLFFLLIYIVYMSFVPIYKDRQWSFSYSYILIHILFLSGFVNYLLLNHTKNFKLAYGYNIFLFLTLLHVLSYNSGGIRNSGNAFMLSIILNAFILLGKRFGLAVTCICFCNLVYFYFINLNTNWIDFGYFKNNIKTVNQDYLITLTICILSIWFQARFLFLIHNEIIDKIKDSNKIIFDNELKTQKLNQSIAENELKALRSQMNPHFTYNVMNSIQYFLLHNQSDNALEYLSKFSNLNRIILNNSMANFVPLEDELKALSIYLELEQMRFDEKLTYSFVVDNTIQPKEFYIPSMILQPFIENSVKHGFHKNAMMGLIKIKIENNFDETITITIIDNGMGIEQSKKLKEHNVKGVIHKSHGIDITKERIRLLNLQYENKAYFDIIDGSENGAQGTTVKLILPILDSTY